MDMKNNMMSNNMKDINKPNNINNSNTNHNNNNNLNRYRLCLISAINKTIL